MFEEQKTKWKNDINDIKIYVFTFLKWISLAILIGAICGLVGTLFYYGVKEATLFRKRCVWLMFLMPLAGIMIVKLYHLFGFTRDRGTNLVIDSVRSGEKVPIYMSLVIFLSTILTHMVGGSSGREGAALQIGGSIGNFLGRRFHFKESDKVICTMCGMSGRYSLYSSQKIIYSKLKPEYVNNDTK